MQVMRGFKFKLTPNKEQRSSLNKWIGANRCLYNVALAQREMTDFREHKVSYGTQAAELKALKTEFPWMKEPPSQTLQQTLRDLDSAFQRFFKGEAQYPSSKKKSQTSGIRFPTPSSINLIPGKSKKKGKVELPKIGVLTFRRSREIGGEIRSCTISREPYGGFSISFLCKVDIPEPVSPVGEIGIDRGIVHTFAFSSLFQGKYFSDLPVDRIKRLEEKVAILQRQIAIKTRFSRNWRKIKNKISRCHSQIARIRHDFLQKEAVQLAKNHGLIVIEDLKTKNMSKSASGTLENPGKMVAQKSGLNKAILRQGWYKFQVMLEHKVAENGGVLLKVNPRNTSRECSKCGHTDKKNRLDQANFCCLKCQFCSNSDINAAINILARGTRASALRVA
jgi:putative transposase